LCIVGKHSTSEHQSFFYSLFVSDEYCQVIPECVRGWPDTCSVL
jgi:hypothetical protein